MLELVLELVRVQEPERVQVRVLEQVPEQVQVRVLALEPVLVHHNQ